MSDDLEAGLWHRIPGFEYEHEPISYPPTGNKGEYISDIGLGLPFATIGRFKPTNPVSWIIHKIVLVTIIVVWLFTFGWILMLAGVVLSLTEESWREMRER